MKRLSEIVLLFCITLGLLTSGKNGARVRSVLHLDSLSGIKQDTTGLIHLLEVDSFNLSIFPPSSGVQFYKDGIIFLSPSKNEVKMLPKHISFGINEAYYAIPEASGLGKHVIFSPSPSFSYPCEAITFSSDFNIMFFTKFSKKDKKEKIYQAKYTSNGKNKSSWLSEKLPVDFCIDNSIYSHPTLSNDEKILIFASDKEPSIGGMDLFITIKKSDKWSEPQNLGNSINTRGNEFYPFLDSENNLFFSSDGLPGYGGYDVFTCKFNGISWDKPINLSERINSENDDIAFTIDKLDGKTAFYTRRHKSGKNEMQLFKVILNQEVADKDLLTISYIFHGKPSVKPILIAENKVVEPKVEVIKEEEVKVAEIKVKADTIPVKIPVIVPETKVNSPKAKVVLIKPTIPLTAEQKDIVIYRIQFLSSAKAQKNLLITLNGVNYTTYEYFYLREYRYTIGEFTSLQPAVDLQNAARRSGYPNAFVAAFKNNTRSLDLQLFK